MTKTLEKSRNYLPLKVFICCAKHIFFSPAFIQLNENLLLLCLTLLCRSFNACPNCQTCLSNSYNKPINAGTLKVAHGKGPIDADVFFSRTPPKFDFQSRTVLLVT